MALCCFTRRRIFVICRCIFSIPALLIAICWKYTRITRWPRRPVARPCMSRKPCKCHRTLNMRLSGPVRLLDSPAYILHRSSVFRQRRNQACVFARFASLPRIQPSMCGPQNCSGQFRQFPFCALFISTNIAEGRGITSEPLSHLYISFTCI